MNKVTYRRFAGFICLGLLLFLNGAALLRAQEGDEFRARIYHAEGTDFILAVGEQRTIYPPDSLGAGGLGLNPRDMIQTGAGSFVELQLIPGGTVVKAAENTSLVFNGPGRDGASVSFDLLYGRIRVIRGAREGDLVVQSGNGAVHIQGGDIGMDYILRPGLSLTGNGIGRPLLRIYGFGGTAELVPLMSGERGEGLSPAGGERARIRIGEGETLAQEVLSGDLSFTERRPLNRDMVDYWVRNDFRGTAPLDMPETAPVFFSAPPSLPEDQILYAPPDYTPFARTNRVKNGGIAAALLFTAVGVGLQGYGHFRVGSLNDAHAKSLINAGFVPLGFGFFTLLMTLIPRASAGL